MKTDTRKVITNWVERQESEKQDYIMLKFRLEKDIVSLDLSDPKQNEEFFDWLLKP